MAVLRALQGLSIYHWDFMTKLINTFVGHTYEEMERKKAFVCNFCVCVIIIIYAFDRI